MSFRRFIVAFLPRDNGAGLPEGARVTEADDTRVTEAGDIRVIE